MNYFSDLFKDKYNSPILREYIEKIVREMSDLKHKNYYAQQEIDKRNREIDKIEAALKELNIDVANITPDTDFEDEYE